MRTLDAANRNFFPVEHNVSQLEKRKLAWKSSAEANPKVLIFPVYASPPQVNIRRTCFPICGSRRSVYLCGEWRWKGFRESLVFQELSSLFMQKPRLITWHKQTLQIETKAFSPWLIPQICQNVNEILQSELSLRTWFLSGARRGLKITTSFNLFFVW